MMKYSEDRTDCENNYSASIDDIFRTQVGNPHLYASQTQGIVDCLIREKLVSPSYTAQKYVEETSDPNHPPKSFNQKDMRVRGCEVANNYIRGYIGDPVEHLW
ncbi:hypothetical protein ACFQY8_06360 [Alloscardovia venturai]|uniref:Uncharacterized protein n=1 Tax=Alloscardovia venturai TaxID=1769421 RepID=A0ABW2Y7Y0_9BIFI